LEDDFYILRIFTDFRMPYEPMSLIRPDQRDLTLSRKERMNVTAPTQMFAAACLPPTAGEKERGSRFRKQPRGNARTTAPVPQSSIPNQRDSKSESLR